MKFLAPLLSVFILCFLTMACQKGSSHAVISSASSPTISFTNEFVIGMGGDVALTRTGSLENSPLGATRDQFLTWAEMSEGLALLTVGNEFNFMNLESVVTDRLDLDTDQKWSQRSNPAGVDYLLSKRGFNLISTANNHETDFGYEGMNDTYSFLKELQSTGLPFYFSGIGYAKDVAEPEIIHAGGITIAFSAIGLKGDGREDRGRPTADKVGMLSIRRCADGSNEALMSGCNSGYGDFEKVLAALKATPADLRILSIHEGTELAAHIAPENVNPGDHQKREVHRVIPKFDLAESYGIDMIIGHHSHNARAVRFQNNQLALFGLGNFLFMGGANMMNAPTALRYGLFARAHFYVDPDKKVSLSALEVIPLKNTHFRPEPWGAKDGAQFIIYLNKLAAVDLGASGVQFTLTKKGTGVFCVPGAKRGPRASTLCSK